MKKNFYLLPIIFFLISCSNEPSGRDLENITSSQFSNLVALLHNESLPGLSISKISGVQDLKIEGIEKIQCSPDPNNSKIYYCEVLIKYEIISSQNSISNLVGISGKKSEVRKLKLFKGNSGWEIL